MDSTLKKSLHTLILQDVAYLCRRDDVLWSHSIAGMLRDLRETGVDAVLFGGTLRSLLISRLRYRRLGRPRDVDIVVHGATLDELRSSFERYISRETRFGGLQLERRPWHFDVWPLEKTWAFVKDGVASPSFEDLPKTTFFNMEAIAVDVWPRAGHERRIFSADDQFFDGLATRTLDINREENPFPALCVIRGLVMAWSLDFSVGNRLARYLVHHGSQLSNSDLLDVQAKHYGMVRLPTSWMRRWIEHIATQLDRSDSVRSIVLPRQQRLWSELDEQEWKQKLARVASAETGRAKLTHRRNGKETDSARQATLFET